jgi:hypothetical protein
MVSKSPSKTTTMDLVKFWLEECEKVPLQATANPIEQVWQDAMMEEGFSSLERQVTEPMESVIDSLIAANGSMEEYQDKVVTEGFSQQEVVDLDETLTPVVGGFSQEEGVSLDGLMHAPPSFGFQYQ